MKPFPAYRHQHYLGCDPEFFFKKDGEIIGSEKVLPEGGLLIGCNKIVRDGIQAELNPSANICRERLRSNIKESFLTIRNHIRDMEGVSVDFSQIVHVSQKEMDELTPKSKQFGCMPSFNIYEDDTNIAVDASKYLYRSAGGHIHIGVLDGQRSKYVLDETLPSWKREEYVRMNAKLDEIADINDAIKSPSALVSVLDIMVANTCVLIDRDPGNIERRKIYGKAGEYRTPKHGLEYRTLSNFWLRSYPLMSFVFGMTRQAVHLVAFSNQENDYIGKLKSLVNMGDIIRAINTNDYDLAYRNFNKIKDFIAEVTPCFVHSLDGQNIQDFEYFVKQGVGHWFKVDPVDAWTNDNYLKNGWERFLSSIVREERILAERSYKDKFIGMFKKS